MPNKRRNLFQYTMTFMVIIHSREVLHNNRKRGRTNTRIAASIIKPSRKHRYTVIYLHREYDNVSAIRLYEKAGFQKDFLHGTTAAIGIRYISNDVILI